MSSGVGYLGRWVDLQEGIFEEEETGTVAAVFPLCKYAFVLSDVRSDGTGSGSG